MIPTHQRAGVAITLLCLVATAACTDTSADEAEVPIVVATTIRPNSQFSAAPGTEGEPSAADVERPDRPEPSDFELKAPPTTAPDDSTPADPVVVSVLDRLPDLSGETVTILGPEVGGDAEEFVAALAPFEAATGATVEYTGTLDDVAELDSALDAGTPPDLAVIAQPGRLVDLADAGSAYPVPESIADSVRSDFDPFWSDLVTRRGLLYAVPNRASVKSLVWYRPGDFAENGYKIPATYADLMLLTEQMRSDGRTPWCIAISSGDATGWVFTDWLEDTVLGLHGAEVYDKWVSHDIDFGDPRILEAIDVVSDVWFRNGNVVGGRDSIVSTTFSDGGLPLVDGDCLLHKQASFYLGQYASAGATLGPNGDIDAFAFPTISDDVGDPVLGAGNHVAAFNDRTATSAMLAYLGSVDYADARIEVGAGGFLSPNLGTDPSAYPTEIERRIAGILLDADPFRFDGSDLMPAVIGSDELWRAATTYVTGATSAQDMVDRIDASWPD